MNRTIIVCSTNRPVQGDTKKSIDALVHAGARLVWQTGSADVAFARNMALTYMLRVTATLNDAVMHGVKHDGPHEFQNCAACSDDTGARVDFCTHCYATCTRCRPGPLLDTILMVDDDMVFSLEQAQEIVTHARTTGVAASAMYATLMGTLAATRLYTPPEHQQRWLVGLGLLAVPYALLQDVARRSEGFTSHGEDRIEFCWSAAYNGEWFAEDYTLCRRFGGVHLLPVAVGHLKTIAAYPDEETIRRVRENERLPGDSERKLVTRVDEPEMLAALRSKN